MITSCELVSGFQGGLEPPDIGDRPYQMIELKNGVSLCSINDDGGLPSGHTLVTRRNVKAAVPQFKSLAESAIGVRLTSNRLDDLIWEIFQTSDNGINPVVPRGGRSYFRLGRLTFSRRVNIRELPKLSSAIADRIDAVRGSAGVTASRRALRRYLEKFGLTEGERSLIQRANDGESLDHGTIEAESFNTADTVSLGVDQTWQRSNVNTKNNGLGQAVGGSGHSLSRVDGLSLGDDVTVHFNKTSGSISTSAGAGCRLDASWNGYAVLFFSSNFRIRRFNASATSGFVNIASSGTIGETIPAKYSIAVSGSDLEGFIDDVSTLTVTDATHATGSPGVYFYQAALGDDWEATDGLTDAVRPFCAFPGLGLGDI